MHHDLIYVYFVILMHATLFHMFILHEIIISNKLINTDRHTYTSHSDVFVLKIVKMNRVEFYDF